MNKGIKVFGLLLVMMVGAVPVSASPQSVGWKALNAVGAVGSAASLAYWLPAAYVGAYCCGVGMAIVSTHIPRVVLDAACVVASANEGLDGKRNNLALLNAACLVGSIYSLALWMPAIKQNGSNPLYVARAAIDGTQILLSAIRFLRSFHASGR